MAYIKNTWATGDTITAAKMNNIEDGIEEAAQSGGGGAVIITDTGGTLDKTFAEIYNLIFNGVPCYILHKDGASPSDLDEVYTYNIALLPVVAVYKYNEDYRIVASSNMMRTVSNVYQGSASSWTYQVSSSQEYPTFLRRTYSNNWSSDTAREIS